MNTRSNIEQDVSLIKTVELPNGLEIGCLLTRDAMSLYDEIFLCEKYLAHGLEVSDDDQVVDVGANIGLFSIYVKQKAKRVKVLAIEPIPQISRVLQWNLQKLTDCKALQIGVSNCELTTELTYYPRSPCMSGLYADQDYDAQLLTTVLTNARPEMAELFKRGMERNLIGLPVQCKLRPLSTILNEHNIQSIDLLKIDVEKSELHVLEGIDERHWPCIRQLVIEIHDLQQNRLKETVSRLRQLGYNVTTEQDQLFRGTDVHMLYAKRI